MCTCTRCGNTLKNAIPIRSQRIRMCWYCNQPNPWELSQGQKGVGYSIDEDLKEEGEEDGNRS